MSFSDPQTVTINAVAIPLARTGSRDNAGSFAASDGNTKMLVSSSYGKRVRRTIRIDSRKVAPDPLFPAQNTPYSMSFYIVADVPTTGYTITEQKQIIDGFLAWLTASSGAKITQLLGGEN